MAYLPNPNTIVEYNNNATLDAFGKLRVTEPYTLFESKFLDGNLNKVWSTQISGGTLTNNDSLSQLELTITGGTGSYVIHQTLHRILYQSGKSQLILLTGTLSSNANLIQRIGLFENDIISLTIPYEPYNGIFFEKSGDTFSICIAKNGVINRVSQNNWNIDKLNGSGSSMVNLDLSKSQIFLFDFEWLGVGRVRAGFNINGVTYYCHEFMHSNIVSSVYMKTPNLPVRYEIRSIGGTGALNQICATVISEGGRERSGFNNVTPSTYFTVPTQGTIQTAVNHTPLFAFRHIRGKGYSYIKLLYLTLLTLGENPLRWSISLVPPTTIINLSASGNRAIENIVFSSQTETTFENYAFSTTGADSVLNTNISNYIIEEGYISNADKAGTNALTEADNLISLGEEISGGRWVFLLTVQSYGINTLRPTIKFTEIL